MVLYVCYLPYISKFPISLTFDAAASRFFGTKSSLQIVGGRNGKQCKLGRGSEGG